MWKRRKGGFDSESELGKGKKSKGGKVISVRTLLLISLGIAAAAVAFHQPRLALPITVGIAVLTLLNSIVDKDDPE